MYHVVLYLNPKGRTPEAGPGNHVGNKRTAIRQARRKLRQAWAVRTADVTLIRAAVRTDDGRLIYQARIDADTAQNGERRMIKDEEL